MVGKTSRVGKEGRTDARISCQDGKSKQIKTTLKLRVQACHTGTRKKRTEEKTHNRIVS